MPRCTKRRVPALQIWPEFWNTAIAAPGTAASRSASAKTMLGDLPPSSIDIRFRLPAAARMIFWPTSVEPVKAILSTPGCAASAAPASPKPVTTLTTPCGHAGLHAQLGQPQRRQRRLLGRLEHDGAARREHRAELPDRQADRAVPRVDRADHADRLLQRVREDVARRPSSAIVSPCHRGRQAGVVAQQARPRAAGRAWCARSGRPCRACRASPARRSAARPGRRAAASPAGGRTA